MDFATPQLRKAKKGKGYVAFDAVMLIIGLVCFAAIGGAGYLVLRVISSKHWKANGNQTVHTPFGQLSVLDVEEGHGMQFSPGDDVVVVWKEFDARTGQVKNEGTISPVALGSGEMSHGIEKSILGQPDIKVPPMRDYGKRMIMVPGSAHTNSPYAEKGMSDQGMGKNYNFESMKRDDEVYELHVYTWQPSISSGGFNDSFRRNNIREEVDGERNPIQIGPYDPNSKSG